MNATPSPPEPLDKGQLELQHLALSNEKLRLEANKLARESEPEKRWVKWTKNLVAAGGIVTIAATVYGIYDSYDKTITDRERTRNEDERTRFGDAIKELESPNTISKLIGVSVLGLYFTKDNTTVHRQILFTLAGLMATETDPQVQEAVLNLIGGIDKTVIRPEDWLYFQKMLTSQSRSLVEKAGLYEKRAFNAASQPSDTERVARSLGKLIALVKRKGVVPDYTDYRGIYCAQCDFHNSSFAKGTDFTRAILDGANFSHTTLESAVFDNAEIAGTDFVEASLPAAQFRSLQAAETDAQHGTQVSLGRTLYIDHLIATIQNYPTVYIELPDFSCANLAGANFDGHALFPGVLDVTRTYDSRQTTKPDWLRESASKGPISDFTVFAVFVRPPRFYKANVDGAHLGKVRFFTVVPRQKSLPAFTSGPVFSFVSEFVSLQGTMQDVAWSPVTTPAQSTRYPPLADFQTDVRASFYSTEFSHAALPTDLKGFLASSPPTLDDYKRTFDLDPNPDQVDPDLTCTPRL